MTVQHAMACYLITFVADAGRVLRAAHSFMMGSPRRLDDATSHGRNARANGGSCGGRIVRCQVIGGNPHLDNKYRYGHEGEAR
jgi:hypothetical protein